MIHITKSHHQTAGCTQHPTRAYRWFRVDSLLNVFLQCLQPASMVLPSDPPPGVSVRIHRTSDIGRFGQIMRVGTSEIGRCGLIMRVGTSEIGRFGLIMGVGHHHISETRNQSERLVSGQGSFEGLVVPSPPPLRLAGPTWSAQNAENGFCFVV